MPLQFDLNGLAEEGELSFERSVEPQALQPLLEDAAILKDPLTLRLEVSRQGERAQFQGTAGGEWELTCARCLGPARSRFRVEFAGESPVQGVLDASEEVRQALYLALPMNARCRPDCKGLCPRCGSNRNAHDCGCRNPDFQARNSNA